MCNSDSFFHDAFFDSAFDDSTSSGGDVNEAGEPFGRFCETPSADGDFPCESISDTQKGDGCDFSSAIEGGDQTRCSAPTGLNPDETRDLTEPNVLSRNHRVVPQVLVTERQEEALPPGTERHDGTANECRVSHAEAAVGRPPYGRDNDGQYLTCSTGELHDTPPTSPELVTSKARMPERLRIEV